MAAEETNPSSHAVTPAPESAPVADAEEEPARGTGRASRPTTRPSRPTRTFTSSSPKGTTSSPTWMRASTRTSSSGDVEPLAASGEDLVVALWVTPGAHRSCVTGVSAGRVTVTVAAPAREGRANDELVAFLAKLLGVPRTAVRPRGRHTQPAQGGTHPRRRRRRGTRTARAPGPCLTMGGTW